MSEQGFRLRSSASEILIYFARVCPTTQSQHCLTKFTTLGLHRLLIVQPCLLEGCKRIRTHYLCPLVAVVACRVAPCKDVSEGAEESVFGKWRQNGEFLSQLVLYVEDGRFSKGVKILGVQLHIHGAEEKLANGLHACLKVLGCLDFLEEFLWERFVGLVVTEKRKRKTREDKRRQEKRGEDR